jgi:large conductance mechanosensitive channel
MINFLLVAVAVYFVLIAPMNAFRESQAKRAEEEPQAPPEDLLVLQEIRDLIRDRRTRSEDRSARFRRFDASRLTV